MKRFFKNIKFTITQGHYSEKIVTQKLDYLLIERINSSSDYDEDFEKVDDWNNTFTYSFYQKSVILQSEDSQILNNDSNFNFSKNLDNLNTVTKVISIPYPADSSCNSNFQVLMNADDQAYIQVISTSEFTEACRKGLIAHIPGSINRIIIWRSLISMTSKLLLRSNHFLEIVQESICEEDDILLLDVIFPTIAACMNWYTPDSMYDELWFNMF